MPPTLVLQYLVVGTKISDLDIAPAGHKGVEQLPVASDLCLVAYPHELNRCSVTLYAMLSTKLNRCSVCLLY